MIEWLGTIFDPFTEEAEFLVINASAQKEAAIRKKEVELLRLQENPDLQSGLRTSRETPKSTLQSDTDSISVMQTPDSVKKTMKDLQRKCDYSLLSERE